MSKRRIERKSIILYEKMKQRHKERRHKSSAKFLAKLRKRHIENNEPTVQNEVRKVDEC